MSKPVQIKLTIPFSHYEVNGPSLYFTLWLPRSPEDGIVVPGEKMSVRLWADDDCIGYVPCYRETEAGRVNIEITVKQVRAVVEGISVSDEMGDLILKLSTETNWIDEHLHKVYDPDLLAENQKLVESAYLTAMEGCNTLISHCRAMNGQFWVNTLRTYVSALPSELLRLKAVVRVGDSKWVRCACAGAVGVEAWSPGRLRCITESDWANMKSAVAAGRRPALVGTLLTIAEELEHQRHYRASLIEAVSALEIAVTQFVSKSDSADWFYKDKERFGVGSIEAHREHLGFTATCWKATEAGLTNVSARVRDFVADGTGLADGTVGYALLFNILHIEDPVGLLREACRILAPGGLAGVIHWRADIETPRGPPTAIRPTVAQCRAWGEDAGLEVVQEVPLCCCSWHWGLVMRRARGVYRT